MANEFYNRGATFNPDELADGDAIEAEFDAIGRGFDTIEDLVNANKAGYPTQTFHVAPAELDTHAVPKAQMDAALSFKLDTVNYNASDILTKLKTVDGASSGLDADYLDGQHGSYYRDASNINAGKLAKERLPGTIDSATTGNAATATKVSGGAPVNGDADLVTGTMGSNDFFRIRVGGTDNAGWVELATADDGNEPILVRQYNGYFGSVARTLTLLDGNGNTIIPGNLYLYGGIALVEYGSNVNGEYYRFADGTQICSLSLSAGAQHPTEHAFAAAFVTAPITLISNDTIAAAYASSVNIVTWKFAFYSSTTSDSVRVIAIGRWK